MALQTNTKDKMFVFMQSRRKERSLKDFFSTTFSTQTALPSPTYRGGFFFGIEKPNASRLGEAFGMFLA
jgi:hypothetical protein